MSVFRHYALSSYALTCALLTVTPVGVLVYYFIRTHARTQAYIQGQKIPSHYQLLYSLVTKQAVSRGLLTKWVVPKSDREVGADLWKWG